MAVYKSPQLNTTPITATNASDLVPHTGTIVVAAGTVLGTADSMQFVKLPAYHVPVDLIIDVPDLDSSATPALAFKVGFIGNGAPYDSDAAFIAAGNTAGQAGGIVRASVVGFSNIAPVAVDRIIGLTPTAAAAAAPAAAATVRMTLLSRVQQKFLGDY